MCSALLLYTRSIASQIKIVSCARRRRFARTYWSKFSNDIFSPLFLFASRSLLSKLREIIKWCRRWCENFMVWILAYFFFSVASLSLFRRALSRLVPMDYIMINLSDAGIKPVMLNRQRNDNKTIDWGIKCRNQSERRSKPSDRKRTKHSQGESDPVAEATDLGPAIASIDMRKSRLYYFHRKRCSLPGIRRKSAVLSHFLLGGGIGNNVKLFRGNG